MTRRRRYRAEFKREALRRADEPGVTDVLVAEELGINARDQELMRLKRIFLAKVEQERYFLREAAAGAPQLGQNPRQPEYAVC